ncbi:hypothetical protein KFK09_002976 [Dendrobium nobile]|uniref:Thymidylate kinase n=1 Tax=Dendrobium nobile TaxID=94219 RepID=A0A8T3C8Q8_DENNO|nr:hypothetical protein KFK09_002976 [Dendrobium nobile]
MKQNLDFIIQGTTPLGKSLKTCIKLASKRVPTQLQMNNSEHVSRGALIVLEGLDRCGKTTQCGKLVSSLEGRGLPVEAWRFPDRNTDIGRMISSYLTNRSQLDDQAIHLLFSANRWEKRSLMENKLRNGITLVVDRYSYSGVSFSAAKGLDIEWCKAPEKGLIAPDLVVYLDIMPEEAASRGGYGSERYEQLEFQRNVAHCYRILHDVAWKVIDARLPLDSIENQIQGLALESIKSCQKKPLSTLWLNN